LKALLHYTVGAIVCLLLGSVALILRVPLRGRRRHDFGTIDEIFAWVIIVIGVVYAVMMVREYLAWKAERRWKRRGKQRRR
jgi:uncharacterized membrane protein